MNKQIFLFFVSNSLNPQKPMAQCLPENAITLPRKITVTRTNQPVCLLRTAQAIRRPHAKEVVHVNLLQVL